MTIERWSGEVFADYNQFYLWDSGKTQTAPTDYSMEDVARRIKTGPFVVVIQPARNFTVPVTIEVHEAEPTFEIAEWDHIAEASLHVPTGRLQVHECTGGEVANFSVAPGWYRVRAFHAGLSTVNGIEGADSYLVTVWPSLEQPVNVVKQYAPESR